jgi:16S rRNA A1518/A1519 N6-dimethyltransferase RsmA/KsgA/DIM1 with predicted DNA glycosylase/AP lyase activity
LAFFLLAFRVSAKSNAASGSRRILPEVLEEVGPPKYPAFAEINRDLFFKIVKAGFSQPRKHLANNLSKSLKIDKKRAEKWLLGNNIKPEQRAETLGIENWINLAKTIK